MDSLDFYRSYHTKPIKKAIHAVCIPLIVLTTFMFSTFSFSNIDIKVKMIKPFTQELKFKFTAESIMCHFMAIYIALYWKYFGFNVALIMTGYFANIYTFAVVWKALDKNWYMNSIYIFFLAWTMQFIGHAIEGNRPALMTSLTQTLFEAPLYSLDYFPYLNLFD